jgi:hypothetical protein
MTKVAILELVELNPPAIAEIFTIDVSTIRVIVMIEIRIKMPLEPILYWNLFNNVMTPGECLLTNPLKQPLDISACTISNLA